MSYLKKYENEESAGFSRRFFALIIDLALIVIVHLFVFIGFNAILINTSSYKNTNNDLTDCMLNCYSIQEEANIYEFKDNDDKKYTNPLSQEEMFEKWAYSQILNSFNYDNSYFVTNNINQLDINNEIKATDLSSDKLSYFFTEFVKNKNEDYKILNENINDYNTYYLNLFKNKAFYYDANNTIDQLWIYNDNSLPILKGQYAYYLYDYLKNNNSSQIELSTYNLICKTYQNIFDYEANLLTNSNEYKKYFDAYLEYYKVLTKKVDISCIISYSLTFILIYVLPIILSKEKRSIGKKIVNVLNVDIKGYSIINKQIIIKCICKYFVFFGITMISSIMAIGNNSAMFYAIFSIGNINISLILIQTILLVLGMISLVVSLFGQKKQDISELISETYLIDLRYYVAHDIGNKMLDESNNDEIEIVDSTTINK